MALTNDNGMVMPVSPMYGNGGGGMFGGWDSSAWLILIVLFALGGWGGFGGYGGGADGSIIYPWMNQSEVTTSGFQNLSTQNQITAVQSDLGDIQTQLCNGFAGVNATVNSGFANAESSANSRQIANMQQAFNSQIATMNGFNGVQSQLAECCCENRLATANLGADIAREACATRTSDTQNTQVILNAINDGFRLMSDQRFQDKIDAKNDEIAQLRQENLYARGQASQIQQNQTIVDAIYNRLDTCPVGTTPVYGRTPIFSCNNNGCGCGNNGFLN